MARKLSQYNKLIPYIKRHFRALYPALTPYKILNISGALVDMKLRRKKCSSRPFMYSIDPSSVCNLRCPPCESHKEVTRKKRIMDYQDFVVIIDKIKNVALGAALFDAGEPFLNKDIYKMIGRCKRNRISTVISTNFNTDIDYVSLINNGLTSLEPCLDGFSQEAYSYYRVGGDVEKVKRNIEKMVETKKKLKSAYPIIDVQVIEFKHIKKEMKQIKEYLQKIEVDNVTFRKENSGFDNNAAVKRKKRKDMCFWLYLGMMVRPDGSVYPCCSRGLNRFSYGSLITQDLSEIWNNKYYIFSRELFTEGKTLVVDEDLARVPCLKCTDFKIKRKIKIINKSDQSIKTN